MTKSTRRKRKAAKKADTKANDMVQTGELKTGEQGLESPQIEITGFFDDNIEVSSGYEGDEEEEDNTNTDLKQGISSRSPRDHTPILNLDLSDGIDDRLPYRKGWPLLPVLPVLTSRKDIRKTYDKTSTHMTSFRAILEDQNIDFSDVEVCHRLHEGDRISKSTLTLCVQANVHVSDEGVRSENSWISAIIALRDYIQTNQLTLSIEIIDSRIFKGLYTLPILPHDTPILNAVKKKKHGIKNLLNECGTEWTSLDFYYRGASPKRSECKPTVLIGVPEPNLAVWWEAVLPGVRGKVKGKLDVEIMYAVLRKC